MAAWLRITGSRADDLIYWQLLLQSPVIKINYKKSNQSAAEPFFLDCRGLAPFSFSFYDWLLIHDWTTYIVSRRTDRKHICFSAMDICEPHRKHRFLYSCIYGALHSNENYPIVACVFVAAYCCRLYLATGCLLRICPHGNVFTSSCPVTGLHVTILSDLDFFRATTISLKSSSGVVVGLQ
jgi:hypothetical protein